MNFIDYQERVQEKDTVILCRGYDKMFTVQVERGRVAQIKGGAIHHDSLIGKQYGSKVQTSNGKSWVLLLHPTPELWTLTLPHRTQIIYSTDTAIITLSLGLRPGSKVIEAGTGSGALSHALSRSVAPNGCLYTFEFHQQRAELAREEFERHGLGGVVTVSCRDVCTEGFGLERMVDGVFLDLPMPWDAIQSARTALKSGGGRFCSFSPCMEQVQRTCLQLHDSGFTDVEVLECVQRPYEVKTHTLTVPDVGVVNDQVGGAPTGMLLSHSLGSASLWTAQATNRIPGHTGFLVTATLY